MDTDELLRPGRGLGQARNRKGGGVGGKDRLRADHRLDLGDHLGLHRRVLEHRLDDEVAGREVRVVGAGVDTPEQGVTVGSLGPALVDLVGDELVRVGLALLRRLDGLVDEYDFHARIGADIGDARAHETGADDADLPDGGGRHGLRPARALVQLAHGEEQRADHRRRLLAAQDMREVPALDAKRLVHRQLQALVDGGQDRLRGGVVVVGLAPVDRIGGGPDHHAGGRVDLARGGLELRLVPGSDSRAAGGDPGLGLGHDLVPARDLVDEAHVAGHQGADLLALEQHLQGVAGLHQAGHALGTAAAREQADLDLGQADAGLGVVREHPVMAREGEFEGAAEADPVHRRREGLAAGLELAEDQGELARFLEEVAHRRFLALLGLQRLERAAEPLQHGQVGAAREIVLAGDDDATLDRRIGHHRVDDLAELIHHRIGEDVHGTAGHVPGRQRDPVGIGLESEVGEIHR